MFSLSRLGISKIGKEAKINLKLDLKISLIITLFALMFCIAAPKALAAETYSIDYDIVNARITVDGTAEYNVMINNYERSDQLLTISLGAEEATRWIVSPSSYKTPASENSNLELKLIPKTGIGLQTYQVKVKFENINGERKEIILPVDVSLDAFYQDYVPNVALGVTAPQVQDPREDMKVTVVIRNRNQLDISNLIIRIRSDFFSTEYNTSLGPRKEKTKEFLFQNLDPLLKPGDYNLHVEVYYPKVQKSIAESDTTFKIESYSSVTQKRETKTSWFLTQDIVILENSGNYERTKEVLINAPWPKRIFMWTDPKTEFVKVDDLPYFRWEPSLKPTETKQIIVYTNYRPIALLVLFIIIALALYYFLRSPVILLKEAAVVSKDEHGVSEIKVRVFIKNRSRRALHTLLITDILPRIIELEESNHMGSVKPTRVARTLKKGTLLYWEIDLLDPYEERILTYRAKSKLKIVGDIVLPRARVKYESSQGIERIAVSPVPLFVK